MRRFRDAYGAGPLHLIGLAACLAITGYAVLRIFDFREPWNVLLWLGGAIVAHDLILYPSYSLLGRFAERFPQQARRVRWINYLRVPALLSAVLLLVYFPLILDLAPTGFDRAAGRVPGDVYLQRWLLIVAGLFLISAVALGTRLVRSR